MMRRPFFVAMRARNPWVRLREMLLGWNVRFMAASPKPPQRIDGREKGAETYGPTSPLSRIDRGGCEQAGKQSER